MSLFSSWVVETFAASTLLMLLVLLLRRPVARLFGPHIAYALWLLPALRTILPPIPGWSTLFVPVAHVGSEPVTIGIVDPVTAATLSHQHVATLMPMAVLPADPTLILTVIWLSGALLWFGWQMLRYRRFVARAVADGRLLSRAGNVDVLVTSLVSGPLAAGIRHRRVFLPADFSTRYTSSERRLALLHEGAHHDRGDLVANLAGLGVVALHWWNPLAHWAWAAFRADQELACDATVLAGAAADDREAYGRAVLKSASTQSPAAACAMNHKSQLKQRIIMMKDRKMSNLRHGLGFGVALALVAGGLALTASGSAAAPTPPVPAAPPAPVAPVTPPTPPAAPQAPVIVMVQKSRQAPAVPAVPGVPGVPGVPAVPLPPQVKTIIVREGMVVMDGKVMADGGAKPGNAATVKTIVINRSASPGVRTGDPARTRRPIIVRCIRTVSAGADTKVTTTDSGKDCGPINLAALDGTGLTVIGTGGLAVMGDTGAQISEMGPAIRESLRSARKSIETNTSLTPDQRQQALAGLDDAMRKFDPEKPVTKAK